MYVSWFLFCVVWDQCQTPQVQRVSLCVNRYQAPESHWGPDKVYFIPLAFDIKTYIRCWVGVAKDLAAGMSGSKQPKDSVQNAAMNDTSILTETEPGFAKESDLMLKIVFLTCNSFFLLLSTLLWIEIQYKWGSLISEKGGQVITLSHLIILLDWSLNLI